MEECITRFERTMDEYAIVMKRGFDAMDQSFARIDQHFERIYSDLRKTRVCIFITMASITAVMLVTMALGFGWL